MGHLPTVIKRFMDRPLQGMVFFDQCIIQGGGLTATAAVPPGTSP